MMSKQLACDVTTASAGGDLHIVFIQQKQEQLQFTCFDTRISSSFHLQRFQPTNRIFVSEQKQTNILDQNEVRIFAESILNSLKKYFKFFDFYGKIKCKVESNINLKQK